MRILVFGAGVVGSVYADALLRAGHQVVILARGRRLQDVQHSGLVLHRADTGQRTCQSVEAVADLAGQVAFDLVLVPVRFEQLASVVPLLAGMTDASDIVFFGNYPETSTELQEVLGDRVLLGFPAVGGVREGAVISYVPITEQQTMLGEPNGQFSTRVERFAQVLTHAGFPTSISGRMDAWLLGHAAFIAPIGCALKLADFDAQRLAQNRGLLWLLVRATRQGLKALNAAGAIEIPVNLGTLYLRLPLVVAFWYWKKVLSGPRGELWFGAHARAAPEEMHRLATVLRTAIHQGQHQAPALLDLINAAHH